MSIKFFSVCLSTCTFICTGWLEFMYVGGSVPLDSSVTLRSRSLKQKPTVHFELDLSNPVDHHTAVLLVERALKVSTQKYWIPNIWSPCCVAQYWYQLPVGLDASVPVSIL
jgi:hypothetical protein